MRQVHVVLLMAVAIFLCEIGKASAQTIQLQLLGKGTDGLNGFGTDVGYCRGSNIIARVTYSGVSTNNGFRIIIDDEPDFNPPYVSQQDYAGTLVGTDINLSVPNPVLDSELAYYVRVLLPNSPSIPAVSTNFRVINSQWRHRNLRENYAASGSPVGSTLLINNGDQLCSGFSVLFTAIPGTTNFGSIQPGVNETTKYAFVDNTTWNAVFNNSTYGWNNLLDQKERQNVNAALSTRLVTLFPEPSCMQITDVISFAVVPQVVGPAIDFSFDDICGPDQNLEVILNRTAGSGGGNGNDTYEYRYPANGITNWSTNWGTPPQYKIALPVAGTVEARARRTPQTGVLNCSTSAYDTDEMTVRDFVTRPALEAVTDICKGSGPLQVGNSAYAPNVTYTWNHDFNAGAFYSPGNNWNDGYYRIYDFTEAGTFGISLLAEQAGKCETADTIFINVSNDEAPQGQLSVYGNSTMIFDTPTPSDYTYSWGYSEWPFDTDVAIAGCSTHVCVIGESYSPTSRLYHIDVSDGTCTGRTFYNYGLVGVEEAESGKLTLYPNPSDGMVRLRSSELISSVTVFDMTGKVILQMLVNAMEVELNIEAASGIYLLRAEMKNGTTERRRLVLH